MIVGIDFLLPISFFALRVYLQRGGFFRLGLVAIKTDISEINTFPPVVSNRAMGKSIKGGG